MSASFSALPQVIVLEQSDIDDTTTFMTKLREFPFCVRVNMERGTFAKKVRRLFVQNTKDANALPFAHKHHLFGCS